MYAHITAIIMAGNRLAVLTFFSQIRLIPTQYIKMEPTIERLLNANGVIISSIKPKSSVILLWKINSGIAAKIHPFCFRSTHD